MGCAPMGAPMGEGCGPVLLLVEGGPCEWVLGLLNLGVASMGWLTLLWDPLGVWLWVLALSRFEVRSGGGKRVMAWWRFLSAASGRELAALSEAEVV